MSQLTFLNSTPYIAQIVVSKGEQIVARLPGIGPQARLTMPADDTFEIAATTLIQGDTYTSAPATFTGAARFLAQIVQHNEQGASDFEMQIQASSAANQLQFQKTTLAPVTFAISQHGAVLQSVVVDDSSEMKTLTTGDAYSFQAVIDGVTTETAITTNADATITAEMDAATGVFTLRVA
jgi:hypothetical protein